MSPETWARAKPLLQAALEAGEDTDETLDDVQEKLLAGAAQLWVNGGTFVVTQVWRGGALDIWLMAGRIRDLPPLLTSCEAWARTLGFGRLVLTEGRPGWARYLRGLGFVNSQDEWLEKPLTKEA